MERGNFPGVVESDLQNLIITPSGGPVDLFVFKNTAKGKGRPGTYSPEVLATFSDLPFRLDVSSLPEGSAAPGKHRVLSTFWGEVKTR